MNIYRAGAVYPRQIGGNMLIVRYATLMRPPMPGAIPREGLLQIKDIEGYTPTKHHAWGWAEYNRYLTEEEIRHYELEYIHSANVVEVEECR